MLMTEGQDLYHVNGFWVKFESVSPPRFGQSVLYILPPHPTHAAYTERVVCKQASS